MGLKDRFRNKVDLLNKKLQKNRELIEKDRAEKMRKKIQKARNYEKGTIRYGLFHKQGVLELMRDAKLRLEEKDKEKERQKENR